MQPAPTLLVVAGAWDTPACDFAARNAGAGAALLVPRDLSRPGWYFRLGDPKATVAVAGDRLFYLRDVTGVLVRLPAVAETDLPHIDAQDRAYVASELTAFLLAVLTQDDLLALNRPTPPSLCGPVWHDAKWRQVAARIGLAPKQPEWRAAIGAAPDKPETAASTVTVVGETFIGASNESLCVAVGALAKTAEAEMLTVEFDATDPSPTVLRAHPQVDLSNPLTEAAVLRLFGIVPQPLTERL